MIKNKHSAFTLAEMMIAMLILTILLAAFSPLMTKRSKVDLSSPWRWASNNSDIYYGIGTNQTAMLGQNGKTSTDTNSLLLLNAGERPALTVKNGNNIANLRLNTNAICFGNQSSCKTESIAIGFNALSSSSLANNLNTAIGAYALQNNESGYANTALGRYASKSNTTGNNNVVIGYNAHEKNTSGSYNVVIGSEAAGLNSSGDYNIAIGNMAMYNLTSGSSNIAIGNKACNNVKTGSNKVCIGNDSGPANVRGHLDPYANTDHNIIYLGDENTTVYIPGHLVVDKYTILGNAGEQYTTFQRFEGYGSTVTGTPILGSMQIVDNTLQVVPWNSHTWYKESGSSVRSLVSSPTFAIPGPNGISPNEISQENQSSSSGRPSGSSGRGSDIALKNVQNEFVAGLKEIKQLKPFNYIYKKDTNKEPQVGVMAQDLQKVFPTSVSKHDDGYLYIRWDEMFYASINAIKELDKMLQDLVVQVKTVVAQVAQHDKQIKALQDENKELKNKVQTLEKQNKSFEARLKAIEKKL